MRKPIHQFDTYTDLKDMLKKSGEKYGDKTAYILKTENPGEYKKVTHKEFRDQINNLGTKLIEMGLKDKRISVIGENRYEWGVAYLSVVTGTGTVVPLDKALPENEIESLILRAEVEAIFYSSKYDEIMKKLREKNNTKIKYFISMDLEKNDGEVFSMHQLMQEGEELLKNGNRDFIDATINAEEMQIMLFTSGTTSISKAVMLSHKNIVSNIMDIAATIKLDENDIMLSFLPLHHTFESTVGFLYPISKGSAIAFCEGIRHIAENVKEYKITAVISVPALFEGIYKQIKKGIQKKGKWETVQKGIKISSFLLKFGIDIRKKLFHEVHENLGGHLRLLVAGGAAFDPEIEKGFKDLGFCTLQGYGLTETSPVVAAEDDKYTRLGSIGKAFPSLDVKILEPNEEGIGELMVKGPTVMLGYYDNEEATKEVLEQDGWFHTGDLAKIDKDGFIFITGRKKYVIVLQNGKNIYPEELEILINKIEGVKESFVYGKPDGNDFKICAKVVYNTELMEELYVLKNEDEIKEKIWQEIKKINKTMPAYKYVREISVTDQELIKTTTQKIKRHEEMKTLV